MQAASLALLSSAVLDRRDALAARFRDGEPFRHIVIDGFLREDHAQAILDAFPAFDVRRALKASSSATRPPQAT